MRMTPTLIGVACGLALFIGLIVWAFEGKPMSEASHHDEMS
jgi:hypothetical protein